MDNFSADFQCDYSCNKDPLNQIFPSQNMCVLEGDIPKSLRNLPYGMYPTCDIYYTNRFSYNKRWNWFPNAIFTPTRREEVQYVFEQFLYHQLPFYIRSGGHCYEQVIPKGYILDLRFFDDIIPDKKTSTVYCGAGAKLGDVIKTLGEINYAIPTGTCSSVGLSGLSLVGGLGFLMRNFGLTCDSIISMDVITADNQLITVSEDCHPDLYWALRGAGTNSYGIVIGFTFKMYYIPTVSVLQLRWDWDPCTFLNVYEAWQAWVSTLPSTISAETVFKYKNGKVRLSVNAMKVGSRFTEWEKVFKPFCPDSSVLYQGNYVGGAELVSSNYTFPFSKTKSKVLFKPLVEMGVNTLIEAMSFLRNNQCEYEALWSIEAGNPGAIAQTDSAFFPRNAFGYMLGFIYWPFESQTAGALDWINRSYQELAPFTSNHSYSGLVDYDLGPDYLNAYYGDHVPRLIKIKNKYDPKNIFHWRQGIPTGFPCE